MTFHKIIFVLHFSPVGLTPSLVQEGMLSVIAALYGYIARKLVRGMNYMAIRDQISLNLSGAPKLTAGRMNGFVENVPMSMLFRRRNGSYC